MTYSRITREKIPWESDMVSGSYCEAAWCHFCSKISLWLLVFSLGTPKALLRLIHFWIQTISSSEMTKSTLEANVLEFVQHLEKGSLSDPPRKADALVQGFCLQPRPSCQVLWGPGIAGKWFVIYPIISLFCYVQYFLCNQRGSYLWRYCNLQYLKKDQITIIY